MLVTLLKNRYSTKVTEIENKLNNHNHDKYIAVDVSNARLAQGNLVTKQILTINYQILTENLLKIK